MLMDQRGVSQLPVTCGGILVGMVSRAELLAAVARGLRAIGEPAAS